MKKTVFKGAGVAIVTPFHKDLTVDYNRLEELIEEQIANNIDSIIICGTTGESATLSDCEHKEVIKFAIEKVNNRVPVIAGTGSNDTLYSLSLTKYAKEVGADAVLAVTPYYNKTTQTGLINHFKYVADNVDIPMILYNVPSRTGVNIAPETCKILSEHKNIVGIKEASGNISQVAKIAKLCPDFDIYSGNDDQIIPILSLGGKGVISVLANILPNETHNICKYYFDGKTKEALELQLKYLDFINALFYEVNPIPVKAAFDLIGKNVGSLRMPLCEMSEKGRKILAVEMKKLSLI